MPESLEPRFQLPEEVEVLRIELAKPFQKVLPGWVKRQYDDSYGGDPREEEDEGEGGSPDKRRRRGWKLVAGGAAIAITVGGMEYFRRQHGTEE